MPPKPPSSTKIQLPSKPGPAGPVYKSDEGSFSQQVARDMRGIRQRHSDLGLPMDDEGITDKMKAALPADSSASQEFEKGPLHPDVLKADARQFTKLQLAEQRARFGHEAHFAGLEKDAAHILRCIEKIPVLVSAIDQQGDTVGPNIRLARMQGHLNLNALGLMDDLCGFFDQFSELADQNMSMLQQRGFHYLKDVSRRPNTTDFDELSAVYQIDLILDHAKQAGEFLRRVKDKYPFFGELLDERGPQIGSSDVNSFQVLLQEMKHALGNRDANPAHLAIIYLRLCKQLLTFLEKSVAGPVLTSQVDRMKKRQADPLLEVSTMADATTNILLGQFMAMGVSEFSKSQKN